MVANSTITGGLGYGKSSRASSVHSRDLMNSIDMLAPTPIDQAIQEANSAAYDPLPDANYSQKASESVQAGPSLMEKLSSKNYSAIEFDKNKLMRDPTKPIGDGDRVSDARSKIEMDTSTKINSFKSDWKQAKTEVYEALKESVDAMNENIIDPDLKVSYGDAVDVFFPSGSSSKASAAAYIIGDAAFGMGSMAAALNKGTAASTVIGESKSDKKLTEEQREALKNDMLVRLQQSSASNPDTRATPGSSGTIALDAPKKSEFSWENFTSDDLLEFMAADSEGEDQREMLALRDAEHDVALVRENHMRILNEYAESNLYTKSVFLEKTGKSRVTEAQFDQATVAQDAGMVLTTASSLQALRGIKIEGDAAAANDMYGGYKNVADISKKIARAGEVDKRIDESQLDYNILARENQGYVASQIKI